MASDGEQLVLAKPPPGAAVVALNQDTRKLSDPTLTLVFHRRRSFCVSLWANMRALREHIKNIALWTSVDNVRSRMSSSVWGTATAARLLRAEALAIVAFAAGCQSYGNEPLQSYTVGQNYSTVADCMFLRLNSPAIGWSKTDLTSQRQSRLALRIGSLERMRVDVIGSGGSSSRIEARYQKSVFGTAADGRMVKRAVDACS